MEKTARLLLLLGMAVGGCVAPVGASSVSIPRDARNVCAAQCGQIGMGLSAVAIMANNVGCVCQGGGFGAPTSQAEPTGGATATAGMATIAMLRQQQEAAAAANNQRMMMTH